MEARYIVDENGKRTGVTLPVELYERHYRGTRRTRRHKSRRGSAT